MNGTAWLGRLRVLTLLLCGLWLLTSLSFPFGWDQGIMASVGDVVLKGGMPYRDAWDMKGPVAYLWFALAQLLFGQGQVGIRILDVALLAWSAAMLGAAGARLTRPSAAPWIGAAFLLCYAAMGYFYNAQPDGATSLALTLAMAPMLGRPLRTRQFAWIGLVAGLGMMLKPVYVAYMALPLWLAVRDSTVPPRQRLRGAALALAGAALPIVGILGWFAARGALGDLVDVHVRYVAANYAGIGQLAIRARLTGVVRFWWSDGHAAALPFLLFGAVTLWRRERAAAALVVGWFFAGLFVVSAQGKYFDYHWTAIFPPAVLLVAVGIEALSRPGPPGAPERPPLVALGNLAAAAMLLPLMLAPALDVKNLLRRVARMDSSAQYYARFGHPGDVYSAADDMAAAAYIRAHTAPDERIAILGYNAPVVYLSGRRNASRFNFALPLVNWEGSTAVRAAYRKEFLRAIEPRPAYIIVGLLFEGKPKTLAQFPEFADYLRRGFEQDTSFGNVDLYRRIPGVANGP